jgi:hypothetical protein
MATNRGKGWRRRRGDGRKQKPATKIPAGELLTFPCNSQCYQEGRTDGRAGFRRIFGGTKVGVYEEFVAKRHEEREEKRQATLKNNAEARHRPIIIDSDEDGAISEIGGDFQEDMDVTVTTCIQNKKEKPAHHRQHDLTDISYKSPLAKPEEVLPIKQRLQLAEQRLASKNVALKTQELQLEDAGRRQTVLKQEIAAEQNKLKLLKTEADMAVAREQQAASQLRAENRTLLQQVATLNQKALDYAHLNQAHQLLQAQFDALRAENTKLESRIARMTKNVGAAAPWQPTEAFNVDDLLNEANDLLRS